MWCQDGHYYQASLGSIKGAEGGGGTGVVEGDEFLKQRGKGKEYGCSGSKTEAQEARGVKGRRDGLGRETGDGETGQEN